MKEKLLKLMWQNAVLNFLLRKIDVKLGAESKLRFGCCGERL